MILFLLIFHKLLFIIFINILLLYNFLKSLLY